MEDAVEPTRVATYFRVSKVEMNAANQEHEVTALCRARGWSVVREFRDSESAAKRRPGFDALMAAARRGEFSVVVAWSLDRFGRGFACFDAFRTLASYGVRVVTIREPWSEANGPALDLLVSVMSWVSGFERERLIERTKAGLERARREGRRIGRPPVNIDVNKALVLRRGGMPLRLVAQHVRCGETTLRRLLAAATALAHTTTVPAKTGVAEVQVQPRVTSMAA